MGGTGLGLAVLSMSLLGSEARADNLTALTAYGLPVNTGLTNNVASLSDTKYFFAYLYAGRSYEFIAYSVQLSHDCAGSFPAIVGVSVSTDSTFATSLTVASSNDGVEGAPTLTGACNVANSTRFTATTSDIHYIKAPSTFSAGNIYVVLRETTLFSPWTSKAAGYEGFIEVHNNTSATVSVTLSAYNSAGVLQGSGLTFNIPANATMFQTAGAVGVPVGSFAGVVLTHNGAYGAISGNITTLSGATGLSFDSSFAPRTDSIRQH